MKSNSNFKQMLYDEALKINIKLTDIMLDQFEKYKDLLLEWNEKMNLTAITEENQIVLKHFVDSLECVKYIPQDKKVIDVGTGAGFPGIVVAIYYHEKIELTLLDALQKRLVFLEEVIKQIDLKNVKLIHGRAEEMARKEEYRDQYDIAIARAVAPLNVLSEYTLPFVKVGGKCLLLKGENVSEEIKQAKNALSVLHSKINNIYQYEYIVENEKYDRCILEIIKNNKTPLKYPRNYGKIKKQPL